MYAIIDTVLIMQPWTFQIGYELMNGKIHMMGNTNIRKKLLIISQILLTIANKNK